MEIPKKHHFRGCLIGQCLGDALGFPREGFPREDCERYVSELLQAWFRGQLDDGDFDGQYTDDSQLARELIQSYVHCRAFNPSDYAGRIAAIFVEERIIGRGMATHHAAMRLAAGVSFRESGTPAPASGNGSAMRAGPIGMMFLNVDQVVQAAIVQGQITHRDSRASAGAVSIAVAVHMAMRLDSIDPSRFVARLVQSTVAIDATFAGYLAELPDCLRLPLDEALDRIAGFGFKQESSSDWDRISPFVIPSVIWSLYAFLKSPENYAAAISIAIRAGGDVDTTAAMTGAISGSHLGLGSLPAQLTQRIHDRETWGYDELVSLSDCLYEIVSGI